MRRNQELKDILCVLQNIARSETQWPNTFSMNTISNAKLNFQALQEGCLRKRFILVLKREFSGIFLVILGRSGEICESETNTEVALLELSYSKFINQKITHQHLPVTPAANIKRVP